MKYAILLSLVALAATPFHESTASEAATDCGAAIDTLRAGIEVHPEQAVVLFQDSIQTNPACRRALLSTALEVLGNDPTLLARLIYAARLEFPEDDSLFAEAALSVVPERANDIRAAFIATAEEMAGVLAGPADEEMVERAPSAESQKMDEEIRDSIARVTAKTEGKAWPEQQLSDQPLAFKKADEVRIPRPSRYADEASLIGSLRLDRHDEREITPTPVKIDDRWEPSDSLRLDETKFAPDDREDATTPLAAKIREMAPAGSVGLPKRPLLPRSSVYYIPPASGSYESTIDLESGASAPPALIIRPESASPTSPR